MPKKKPKPKKPSIELEKITIDPPISLFRKFLKEVEVKIADMEKSGFKDRMFATKSANLKRIAIIDAKMKIFSRKYIWSNYGRPNTLYPPQKEIDKDQVLFKEKTRLYKEYMALTGKYFKALAARKFWREMIEVNTKKNPPAQGEK